MLILVVKWQQVINEKKSQIMHFRSSSQPWSFSFVLGINTWTMYGGLDLAIVWLSVTRVILETLGSVCARGGPWSLACLGVCSSQSYWGLVSSSQGLGIGSITASMVWSWGQWALGCPGEPWPRVALGPSWSVVGWVQDQKGKQWQEWDESWATVPRTEESAFGQVCDKGHACDYRWYSCSLALWICPCSQHVWKKQFFGNNNKVIFPYRLLPECSLLVSQTQV